MARTDDRYLLGIDIGISTAKAALFTLDGAMIGLQSEEYLLTPESQIVESDPGPTYWDPIVRAVRRLLQAFPGRSEQIVAVSTSTFCETLYPMRADGTPSRPSISWMDNRSAAESQALVERVGARELQRISGQGDFGPIWPATKMLWMKRHEPEAYARTAKFLMPDDYILLRLSGAMVAEQTMWTSSLVMDLHRKAWSPALMEAVEITPDKLPALTPTGTVVGKISPQCAAETGLSTRTQVVAGAMDQMCSAVGAGNIVPGIITESTGTVVALLTTIPAPIIDYDTRVPCHLHAVPDAYCLMPWSPTGGLVLKWWKDRYCEEERRRAAEAGRNVYDVLTELAAGAPAGSDRLIMLPHLEGAGFPDFAPGARGAFFGLTLHHGKAHLTRAILEAIAYLIRSDVETLRGLGIRPSEVRVLGGGAKSALWNQIKADVLGLPIAVPANRDAALLGTAIIASVGAGLQPDIATAVKAMTRIETRLQPDPANGQLYAEAYRRYRGLFERVRDLF
jgi:xylulokinase